MKLRLLLSLSSRPQSLLSCDCYCFLDEEIGKFNGFTVILRLASAPRMPFLCLARHTHNVPTVLRRSFAVEAMKSTLIGRPWA